MRIYVTQVVGGHEVQVSVWTNPQELIEQEHFTREMVEEAERDGEVYVDSDSVHVEELTGLWSIVGSWDDPEPGVAVYGPWATEREAQESLAQVAVDFGANVCGVVADEENRNIFDLLPEDVRLEVVSMLTPAKIA